MKNSKTKVFKVETFFFLLFIFLISCEERKEPKQNNEKEKAIMLTHLIEVDTAFTMYDNYTDKRIEITKDTLQSLYGSKFYDTRTVWFDIETLKEYIKYVEERSKENKIKPEGFKICFGAYSNNDSLGNKANHQNVFFVPTAKKDGRQAAYTIDKKRGILFLQHARKFINENTAVQEKAGFLSFSVAFDEKGLILNKGESSPPPDSTDEDFK